MSEPRWIRLDVVKALHLRQLAEHGGGTGVRDEGLLESAVARPQNAWVYGDPPPDFDALAASYAFGLARNHPFVDGNKRAAFIVCRTFLLLNGWDFEATSKERYEVFMALARGELSEDGLSQWLRSRLVTFSP